MTEPDPKTPSARRRRPTRRVVVGVVLGGVLLSTGIGVYLGRLVIARDVLAGWLAQRGVDAELKFETFGLGGLSGTIKVGPTDRPVLTAEEMVVRYGFRGFWSGDPFGLQIRSVKLVRPVLHASLKDGKLTLGPLDRIVEEFRRRPPRPGEPKPDVRIEDGLVILQSDYGPLQVRGDARVGDGKLLRLDVRSSAARLDNGADFADLGPGGLTVRTRDGRMDVLFQVYVAQLGSKSLGAKGVNVRLAGQVPYPDFDKKSASGPVALRLVVAGGGLSYDAQRLEDLRLEARFDGRASGWIPTLALAGAGEFEAAAESGAFSDAAARKLRAKFDADQLTWTRKGGDRLAARYDLAFQAAELVAADLRLRQARATFEGSGAVGKPGVDLQMRGAASANGAWNALGAPTKADDPEMVALKRALGDFSLSAPSVALAFASDAARLQLPAPVTVRTRSNGVATVTSVSAAPVYDGGAGRFRLDAQGGGLPKLHLAVDRFTTDPNGVTASTRLTAEGALGPVRGGSLATAGQARIAGGGLTYVARDCASLAAERLEFGANDVEALKTRLCPSGAPLLTFADGTIRVRTQARGLDARAPFLNVRASDATADLDLTARGGALHGAIAIRTAKVTDTAPERRFNPLLASGDATVKAGVWRADIDLSDAAQRHVATLDLRHDLAKGQGEVDIQTGELVFAEGGLQPAELSPLMTALGAPVSGNASFTGKAAWTSAGLTSRGELSIGELNFQSPAGVVTGLSGEIAFSSLAPLTAAAGQKLVARQVELMGPVTDVAATFGLDEGVLRLEGATAQVGGGQVRVDKIDLPLKAGASWSGAVNFEAVQVEDLVKASPFGDRMALNARLSGRLPFSVTPEGLRISGGELHAIEPGTLSIKREALTGIQAESGVAVDVPGVSSAPPPGAGDNLVADFAYQALEHLAFDKLAAEVDSRPEGRLGVMFWIKGEFKPPQHQEIRLGYLEALNGSYMDRKLPLPSNTKVDLALDTSVNLDQLLADYTEYQKLRGSGPVQP